MPLGSLARKILGKKFIVLGRVYRGFFVDLKKVCHLLSEHIPPNAHVLDIGGGDGEPLNYLLSARHDIHVTMIDSSKDIGSFVKKEYESRIRKVPNTTIEQFFNQVMPKIDCVLISDVIHHIPVGVRSIFFANIIKFSRSNNAVIIIKDVEPGYLLSKLGYYSDRYITGDKNVTLISRGEIKKYLAGASPGIKIIDTDLFVKNKPNYMIIAQAQA